MSHRLVMAPTNGNSNKPTPWSSTLAHLRRRTVGAWRAVTNDDSHLPLGKRGERAARRFLRRKGFKIVGVSEQLEGGEIDLVAVDRGSIVFVEVKTRSHHDAGRPEEAVDDRKQRKLTRLALQFMKRHDLLSTPARFDVVAITWPDGTKVPTIVHFVNAFEPTGKWQLHS